MKKILIAVKILEEIRSGRTGGFCAQYNYIFVQALQSLGIKSRYVTIKNHEVTEVWISELKKWICFDPLYNSVYLSKENIPLSIIEIYRNRYNNESINFSKGHLIKNRKDQLNKFVFFSIWLKNDHISHPINFVDIEYYKVHYIDDFIIKDNIPENSLFTTYERDLYFEPDN